ncbi:hypothetical protein [Thermomonas paludicola]|uniref:hypothetical protein n=1 Tax=Thermomonas paludicola TaxID=2884874 RepID=UPI00211493DF|nr:hypothetical protein [Thermomonas paludicola]
MNIILAPYSPVYLIVSLTTVAVWLFVLLPRVSLRVRWWLHFPALLLHETCHFIAVVLLGGSARMQLGLGQDSHGSLTYGSVHYEGVGLGQVGKTLVSIAPLLLFVAAAAIAHLKLGQPQPVLEGLGWLGAILCCLLGASMYSSSDWRGTGLLGKFFVVTSALQIALMPVFYVAWGIELLIGK